MTALSKIRKLARGGVARRALALAGLLAALGPAATLACGLPLGARIPAEQALISYANGREEIITSVQLAADRPGAAVIFPVPGAPEVSALANADLFDYLADVTRPQLRTTEVALGPGTLPPDAGGAPGSAVNVLGRELIGGYDVARLASDDAAALSDWLSQNGFSAPPGAAPILQGYADAGWRFVAVKLAGDRPPNGRLAPLRLAFDTPRIVYPMRLGALADRPLDVLLYVLADHRVEHAQLPTEYAGPVAQLDRAPPARLAELFRAPYLTKLRSTSLAPTALTDDFVLSQAGDDAPFRSVETRTVYVTAAAKAAAQRGIAGAIVGVVLVFLASSVALGFALGLRKRINAIAGPDPDKEDD
jgi:hypothetical protein